MNEKMNLNISEIMQKIQNIDFEFLMSVLKPFVIYYISYSIFLEQNDAYNLHKDFIPKDISKVVLPPELTQEETEVDYEKLSSKWFGKEVIEFAKFLEKEFPQADLVNFYNNINRLSVETYEPKRKRIIIDKISKAEGVYNVESNLIRIEKGLVENTIFHELFHMASSRYVDDIVYSGFSQGKKASFAIGDGLNEGYTQLLSERYFGHVEGLKGAYSYLVIVVGLLEEAVGAEKMTSLYLKADLPGLINELKEYASEGEIMRFLSALDFVKDHLMEVAGLPLENALITQSLVTINEFLLKIHIVKAKKMFLQGEGDGEGFSKYLVEYISKIGGKVTIDKRDYNYLDNKRIKEIFANNLSKEDINKIISKKEAVENKI